MKTLSKSSQIPHYLQVVEWIRENIYSGDLAEDDRIPSEFQIMDMLDVSRGTVKKAVNQLVREGLLMKVQGKGTFVYAIFYTLSSNIWPTAQAMVERTGISLPVVDLGWPPLTTIT